MNIEQAIAKAKDRLAKEMTERAGFIKDECDRRLAYIAKSPGLSALAKSLTVGFATRDGSITRRLAEALSPSSALGKAFPDIKDREKEVAFVYEAIILTAGNPPYGERPDHALLSGPSLLKTAHKHATNACAGAYRYLATGKTGAEAIPGGRG